MEDVSVKMACLCGGSFIEVPADVSMDEVSRINNFSLGTLLERDEQVGTQEFYQRVLPQLSNQYVCHHEHIQQFREELNRLLPDGAPSFLVIADSLSNDDQQEIYCVRVDSVKSAIQASSNQAQMLICSEPSLVASIKTAVPCLEGQLPVPVFLEVDSFEVLESSLENNVPFDGTIVRFVPTPEEVEKMLQWQVERASDWKRKDDECIIGVLSHQGDYRLHVQALQQVVIEHGLTDEVRVVEARTVSEIKQLDGLLLPGGWSNLQGQILEATGIDQVVRQRKEDGLPIMAVCAGMILARTADGDFCGGRPHLDLIEMTIQNNKLDGELPVVRKSESGEDVTELQCFSNGPFAEEFPESVSTLAWVASGPHAEKAVGVKQGNVSAFAFHHGIHKQFVDQCLEVARNE